LEKYFNVLQKCTLFNGIEKERLLGMLTCLGARVVTADKKSPILEEGSPAKHIGILLSGSAQIVRADYYGNRSILSDVHPADTFAESFACAEAEALPISVTAIDQCEAMLIDCRHVLHTCSNNCGFHQQLIFNLMKELASKNLSYHQRIEVTSKRTTRDKLLTYLHIKAKQAKSSTFTIPFDRQELADYLEVDRSGLSAEISKLRSEGIIENEKSTFKIL
jgi:CRP-like cAMP-binding protein